MLWIRNILTVSASCPKEKVNSSEINHTGAGEGLSLQECRASQVRGQDCKEWKSSPCEVAGPRDGSKQGTRMMYTEGWGEGIDLGVWD